MYERIKLRAIGKFHIFLAEIEFQFYERAELYELLPHIFQVSAKATAQIMYSRFMCRAALAGYQVGYCLGLCEVEFIVKKCSHGKLSGLCHPSAVLQA